MGLQIATTDSRTKPIPTVIEAADSDDVTQVVISMSDGVFIKQITAKRAGAVLAQHSHAFDHTSLLAVGALRIWQDGVWMGDYQAPTPISIKAGIQHQMQALADGTVFYCCHNIARTGEVEELEQGRLPTPAPRPEPDAQGMMVAEEPWPDCWGDAQALIAEHHAAIGGNRDGVPLDVNTPMLDRLHAEGALQIMTARSNGRMFGYLMTILSASVENVGMMVATTTAFYASPDAKGVGAKMLRAAVDGLRARGVHEVILRAGVRGDGPRLGALYERMGAKPHGELYSLMLREV